MCESLVGAANPAMRQKGTETFRPGGVPKRPGVLGTFQSGGALMAVAMVTVTFGIVSDAKLSHDCCASARGAIASATIAAPTDRPRPFFIPPPMTICARVPVAHHTPRLIDLAVAIGPSARDARSG